MQVLTVYTLQNSDNTHLEIADNLLDSGCIYTPNDDDVHPEILEKVK